MKSENLDCSEFNTLKHHEDVCRMYGARCGCNYLEESQPSNKHHQLGVKALMLLPSKDGRRKLVTSLSPCRKRQGKRWFFVGFSRVRHRGVRPSEDQSTLAIHLLPDLGKKHKNNDHITTRFCESATKVTLLVVLSSLISLL